MEKILELLTNSPEASIRYKIRRFVLGEDPFSDRMIDLQKQIHTSPAAVTLLARRGADGRIDLQPYQKWHGAHWVLAQLADLYYPPGDSSLFAMRDQVIEWLPNLSKHLVLQGRERFCASIPGNALFAMLRLGIATPYADEIARLLIKGQWPDGGWNCDKHPEARVSSFHETLIPLRAMVLYARQSGDPRARECAERAAEVFLTRKLVRRLTNGNIIASHFIKLHYPYTWHYTFLYALVVMMEGGWLGDPRCVEALDLLESKRLPDGGFPAEQAYYRVHTGEGHPSNSTPVNWGGTSQKNLNPWVSAEAFSVLCAAGRINLAIEGEH